MSVLCDDIIFLSQLDSLFQYTFLLVFLYTISTVYVCGNHSASIQTKPFAIKENKMINVQIQ